MVISRRQQDINYALCYTANTSSSTIHFTLYLITRKFLKFSKMIVTAAEEENNTEVRREDQNNINKFARLNARLHELRDERKVIKVGQVDA